MKDSFRNSFMLLAIFAAFWGSAALSAPQSDFLTHYKEPPFHASRYQGGAQPIPGKVLCAYYDLGGEGVAYHDSDAKNNGSGELHPSDGTYLNEFRIHKGVD